MDYERLYSYRFRDAHQPVRLGVWGEIAPQVHGLMGSPSVVLDPAAPAAFDPRLPEDAIGLEAARQQFLVIGRN